MKKNIKITLGISIFLAVIIASFFFINNATNLFSVSTTPNECYGGSVLSLSSATIVDSSSLNKKVIRATFSSIPNSECLHIQLNPSEIQSALSNAGIKNFQANNNVLGDIELSKSQKIYNINERSDKILRKINLIPTSLGVFDFCTTNFCKSKYPSYNIINGIKKSTIGGCNCVSYQDIGILGEALSSESYSWETRIKIGDNSPLILTQNSLSGVIGNIAVVKWSGNLISNDNLGYINRDFFKSLSDNQFRLVSKFDYAFYQSKLNSMVSEIKSSSCDAVATAVCSSSTLNNLNAYNSYVDGLVINQISNWASSEPMVKDANIQSNKLIVNLKSPIVYPTFTLDIDAQQVGIFISTGEPKVTCPSNIAQLISGKTQNVNILLKNVGTGSGSFSYGLTCNKGSQVLSPSPPQRIESQGSININTLLGLTVIEGTDYASCTFTATDINTAYYGTPKSDSCSFSYSSIHQSTCVAGSKSCESGNKELWACKSDGSYDKTSCDYGCESFENTYRCKLQAEEICDNKIDDDGDKLIDRLDSDCESEGECKWYNIICKLKGIFSTLGNIATILKIIVMIVAVLFSLFFGKRILSDIIGMDTTENKFAVWTIASLIAIGIGVGLYALLFTALFWIVSISAIILFIILKFIPFRNLIK